MPLPDRVLETVVLEHDLPEHGLRKNDLGTVVHVHGNGGLEVEFMTAGGRTAALVSLRDADVRAAADFDLVSVRPHRHSK